MTLTEHAFHEPRHGEVFPTTRLSLTRDVTDEIDRRRLEIAGRCGDEFADRWADALTRSPQLRLIYGIGV